MSTLRPDRRRDYLVRDLVRDYCRVYLILVGQARRLERDRSLSYATLRDLVGESMRQGVFWRLKDAAHHIFRRAAAPKLEAGDAFLSEWRSVAGCLSGTGESTPEEHLLDWCVGYAFHECVKLKEDAFLQQHYANRFARFRRTAHLPAKFSAPLAGLTSQTLASSARELRHILNLLEHGMLILPSVLRDLGLNRSLARWLAIKEDMARSAFGVGYMHLVQTLHGTPGRLHLVAARDLRDAGKPDEARALLMRAAGRGDLDAEGLDLLARMTAEAEAENADARKAG